MNSDDAFDIFELEDFSKFFNSYKDIVLDTSFLMRQIAWAAEVNKDKFPNLFNDIVDKWQEIT